MEDKIWECIIKRLTDNETTASQTILNNWLTNNPSNEKQFLEIKYLWELSANLSQQKNEASFNLIKPAHIDVEEANINYKIKKNSFWKYSIAASIAIVCLWGFYALNNSKKVVAQEWVVKKTTAGQIMKLILPDSSSVWLNAGSEISFAKNFTQNKLRAVKLKGEAYFEVKHDNAHPFVVENEEFTTTVYGTSFNISAYPKENLASIAVNSGKVGVLKTGIKNSAAMMLLPNNKLLYNYRLKTFTKSNIATKEVNSWINGELVFEQTPVAIVLAKLARKFNVTINADAAKYQDCKLTAKFQNQSLKEILQTLTQLMNIKSKQINQTIYIEGGTSCSKK
jgi:transmembrane sensor